MKYEEWLASVPRSITDDPLWHTTLYRQAVFIGDLSWYDTCRLIKAPRMLSVSDQLYRAIGSISANISEGYSRASEKDQARFYEYSLGSAREARDWYYKSRFVLGHTVTDHRMSLLVHIVRQLSTMVLKYRGKYIHEDSTQYEVISLQDLLQLVLMPEE